MSAGPIQQERDGHKVPPASTAAKDRVCAIIDGRAYCGRRSKIASVLWDRVTCADCHAARRADEAAAS